jgi:hypothetical protein
MSSFGILDLGLRISSSNPKSEIQNRNVAPPKDTDAKAPRGRARLGELFNLYDNPKSKIGRSLP